MKQPAHPTLSITPAFRRRFAYGLAILAAAAGLCGLFFALLSVASSRGRPQAPALELHLELSKTRWREDEYLWYRLEVANVGKSIVPIHDAFWIFQGLHGKNWEREQGTFFQITDEKGKEVLLGTESSEHGVFYMWGDDRSRYTPPNRRGVRGFLFQLLHRDVIPPAIFWPLFQNFMEKWDKDLDVPKIRVAPVLLLGPGERFAATPSVVKPVDPSSRNPRHLGPEGDPRLIPYAPRGWSREKVEELKRTWKREMEDSNLWGRSRFVRNPRDLPPPNGFRVLERSAWGLKPGKYRIKAIYNTRAKLPPLSAEEEIEKGRASHDPLDYKGPSWGDFFEKETIKKWEKITSSDLEKIREQRRKIEARNKHEVYVESNAIEIEVVP